MATLVFSTIGNALGGPVGGAIGALIGQSLDQQLLSPPRRGPRVGDLNVQSSSYGTQIPRLYGSMRVAGSVIWSTDLIEAEQTSGAKGQPDVSYSYSVSMAVALSSRATGSIGRIWADGQLLRGAAGDFKVATTFRFYDGSEDQPIDPLIASVEGIGNSPAYRGLALAVFENLQLASFGNRIPFLTFEVIADAADVPVVAILNDVSGGGIAGAADESVIGYAAYGASVAAAVEPLVSSFGVDLFDDGSRLRMPDPAAAVVVEAGELGSSADADAASKIELEHMPADRAPATLRLNYYDPSRDYQAGEARALSGLQDGGEVQEDVPAALTADAAKTLAHRMVARQWRQLDRLKLRLPPKRLSLVPGTLIETDAAAGIWVIDKISIEGFCAIAELRPQSDSGPGLTADGGRAVIPADVVEAAPALALIDIPNVTGSGSNAAAVLIAASTSSAGWRARAVTLTGGGLTTSVQTASLKSVLGLATTPLGDAAGAILDMSGSVVVELVDADQWLTGCDDVALAAGKNLALLGSELLQFGTVTPLGSGRFRIERLLRARGGTDWATGLHETGDRFCLLDPARLQQVDVPLASRGALLTVSDPSGAYADCAFGAEWVRPLPPAHLRASSAPAGLTLSWIRRSRSGFAWLDDIDAPLGEAAEQYRVTIASAVASIEYMTSSPGLVLAASDLAPLGSGPALVDVCQLGDCAASRPASISITLP